MLGWSMQQRHSKLLALQTGGYATDPSYGDKLVGVMQTIGKV